MSVIAKLRYLRIAPLKVRLVVDLIRGKSVEEAQTILRFTIKKAAQPILKLLKSAIANAKNNFQLDETNLYISKITVDGGPRYKRWRARARGRAAEIQKKTSHVTICLGETVKKLKKIRRVKKVRPEGVRLSSAEVLGTKVEKIPKTAKPQKEGKSFTGQAKFKPELEISKPKIEKGIKRIFRRKAF